MLLVKTKVLPSSIQGLGLFADQDISKDSTMWRFTPPFDLSTTCESVNELPEIARQQFLKYSYVDKKSGNYILSFDDDRFFNHSDNPNVGEMNGSVVALRDIRLGEELTCNYFEFDSEASEKLY